MEIKVVQDVKTIDADILVVNMFEGENTTSNLANTYALQQDGFKGKFNQGKKKEPLKALFLKMVGVRRLELLTLSL